jgi:putative spermidine/putrescine transport system ATP-binding protein
VEQVAAPAELYENPASSFVAGFVGTSNLLSGQVARVVLGREGMYSIRPEKLQLVAGERAGSRVRGTVEAVVYLGSVNHYVVSLERGGTLTVLRQNSHGTSDQAVGRGDTVSLTWDDEHLIDLTPSGSPPASARTSAPASAPASAPTASGHHQEEA